MKGSSTSLFSRCRTLLVSECSNEFESNEHVKSIFFGTEIEEYSRHFHDQKNPTTELTK